MISVSQNDTDRNHFEVLPLFKDEIFLAVPAGSPFDNNNPADLREFSYEKFISLAGGFATCAGFQEAFHIAEFEPEIVTRVNDIFSMESLVQAGVGLMLMPGRMEKVYEHSIRMLKLAGQYQMEQTIAMVFARNREHDPNLPALTAEGRMYTRSLIDKA